MKPRLKLWTGWLLLASAFATPMASAQIRSDVCATLLVRLGQQLRRAAEESANWGRRWRTLDGAKENTISLFLKEHRAGNPKYKLGGFATRVGDQPELRWYQAPVERFMRFAHVKTTQGITRALGRPHTPASTYYISAFNGFGNVAMNLPNYLVRPLTWTVMRRSHELRLPYIFGAYAYYTAPAITKQIDKLFQEAGTEEVRRLARQHGEELDRQMANEFEYREFWEWAQVAMKQGLADREKVRVLFMIFTQEKKNYFEDLAKEFANGTHLSLSEKLDRYLPMRDFDHIRQYIEESERGDPLPERYRIRPGCNYGYRPKVVEDLLELNHAYLYTQSITDHVVRSHIASRKLERGQSVNQAERDALKFVSDQKNAADSAKKTILMDNIILTNDDYGTGYVQSLFELYEMGRITEQDLIFRIKEENYYRRKFLEFDVLCVDLMVNTTKRNAAGKEIPVFDTDGNPVKEIYTPALQRRISAAHLREQKQGPKKRKPSSDGEEIPEVWVARPIAPF